MSENSDSVDLELSAATRVVPIFDVAHSGIDLKLLRLNLRRTVCGTEQTRSAPEWCHYAAWTTVRRRSREPMKRIPILVMMFIATLALLAATLPAYPAAIAVTTHAFIR
jgi:hypothetical protein